VNTPFTLASDIFTVYICDFTNCDTVPFMDAGIVLPVTFEGRPGGHQLYEYEDDDGAMAAGRELWGYPKKFAAIEMTADDTGVRGRVIRKGTTIYEIGATFDGAEAPPTLTLAPHFNIKIDQAPDGGIHSRRVIERDTSPDFETISVTHGTGSASLVDTAEDPFGLLGDFRVVGASYTVGNFHATEQNGWGRIVAEL